MNNELYIGGKDWYLFGDGTLELKEIPPQDYTLQHDPQTNSTKIVVTLRREENEQTPQS